MTEEISTGEYIRKWGLIFGLVGGLIFIAVAAGRIDLGFAGTPINWVVVITFLVLSINEFKRDNGGYVGFGQAFKIAFFTATLGGVIRGILQYTYVMIDPEFLTFQKELMENSSFGPPRDEMQEVPSGFQGVLDFVQSAEFLPIASLLAAIFAGLIFGAVVAAILKNEADEF